MFSSKVPEQYLRIRESVALQARTCIYCWESFDDGYAATRCEQEHEALVPSETLKGRIREFRRVVLGL